MSQKLFKRIRLYSRIQRQDYRKLKKQYKQLPLEGKKKIQEHLKKYV